MKKFTLSTITCFIALSTSCANTDYSLKLCLDELKTTHKKRHLTRLKKMAYQCTKTYPNNAELFYIRGLFDTEFKNYYKAILSFKKAIQLNENNVASYQHLLSVYLSKQSSIESFQWLIKRLVEKFQDQPATLLLFVDQFIEYKHIEYSIYFLKYLIDQKCKSPWMILLKLGEIHYANNNIEKAIQAFEASLREKPKSSYTMFCLGKAWLAKGNHKYALSYYQHAKTLGANQQLLNAMNKDFKLILEFQKK
ncbi:MAG: hypothetical protein KC646_03900 [Candidatus Cloacimonetes bacterium]|nr:hypothetical protein [Candidatus Cloacimonadota bacterium]